MVGNKKAISSLEQVLTRNDPKCGGSRTDDGQAEWCPARVDRDHKQFEDCDQVQVKIICQASERPDNRDGDDSGHDHTPVGKLEQLVLAKQLSKTVVMTVLLPYLVHSEVLVYDAGIVRKVKLAISFCNSSHFVITSALPAPPHAATVTGILLKSIILLCFKCQITK